MNANGTLHMGGDVTHQLERDLGLLKASPWWHLRNWRQNRWRHSVGAPLRYLGRLGGTIEFRSQLHGAVYSRPAELPADIRARIDDLIARGFDVRELPRYFGGQTLDYGLLGCRVVTTAGVNFLVDAFQGIVEPEILRYHGFGTGTNAEAVGDTALQTEETTQYNPDNTRPTGTLAEGASANIYRTVGSYSPDSGGTRAITEHGIFSQAATGGGTLWDRTVFSVVNVVASTDTLQTTYELTCAAGS